MCEWVCVLFPDGPPVEVGDLEGIIIAFEQSLSFSLGVDK